MSVSIQLRRGSTTNHSAFAGLTGEVTVDTTKKTLVLHDGSTLGGTPLAKEVHTHTSTQVSGLTYQTIQVAGSAQTQQPIINLSSLFQASNDGINNRTTVDLANNNTSGAGTYGSATQVARITVNAEGLITAVSAVTVSGVAPAGTASGDLTGAYPGPSVATVGGQAGSNIAAATVIVQNATNSNIGSTLIMRDPSGNFSANVITATFVGSVTGNCSGTAGSFTGNLSGDVTSSGMATTLSNSGASAGTYGSATQVPQVHVDAKGRVTSVSNVTISGVAPAGGAGGDLSGNYPSPNVNTVGGVSASAIATATTAVTNATASNTGTTLVSRDSNGSSQFTAVYNAINVVTTSATPSFNLGLGNIQQMTIAAPITVTLSGLNASAGQFIAFDFIHDGTSTNFAITWPGTVFGGGGNVGVGPTKHNTQLFYCDGTNLFALDQIRTDLS